MTKEEKQIFEKLGEVWNEYRSLPEEHQSDMKEVEFHIHAIQNIILSRPTLRVYYEENKK